MIRVCVLFITCLTLLMADPTIKSQQIAERQAVVLSKNVSDTAIIKKARVAVQKASPGGSVLVTTYENRAARIVIRFVGAEVEVIAENGRITRSRVTRR
jgi:hypothetical protein